MFLLPGQSIGSFLIRDIIGTGSTGVVYLVVDPTTQEERAIKLLSKEVWENTDDDLVARYRQEVQVAGEFKHPGLITVYGFGEHQGAPYIVMEYRRAPSLAKRLKQGPLPVPEALSLLRQLASALQVVHDHGIVHRDLKPANILYDEKGQATIIDFGLARLRGGSITRIGAIMGALGYCAPEQIQATHRVDHRADLFALGVLLYFALTGVRPFPISSMEDYIEAVLHKEPTPLRQINPQIPQEVEHLCNWLLAKDAERRCPSTQGLIQVLDQIGSGA